MANFYKKMQLGRSMIEMLGVLAIIGVLSIASISGYTKAMDQYNWNKALDQWNSLISLVNRYRTELHLNCPNGDDRVNVIPILSGFSDLPEEMITPDGKMLRDAMKNQITVYSHGSGYIGILSKNIEENNKSCRLMLTIAQYRHESIDWLQIYNSAQDTDLFYGDDLCCNKCKCLKDIRISDIDSACRNNSVCTSSDSCNYLIIWR